ncbi:MAG: sigma-54 dependent transcriptional regulator [Desulfurivibrionaceae bacterium]|nr:sigma-54 dependent transcriptional regulator [Desulfurivibrionaceae bacterium]
MYTILIVDDEPNYLIVLQDLLEDEGFEVFTANNGQEALHICRDTDLDLVLTDMQMPGMGGMELLTKIKDETPQLPVIMMTAFGEVDKAVAAMQAGSFNFLSKPFKNDELLANINKAIEHHSLLRENIRLRNEAKQRCDFAGMVGKNRIMQDIYSLIEKVAPTSTSILITGESGTGKELIAKAIHSNSKRENGPFISVNCAALPGSLLESELFGHEKGAFTGAISMRKGRFERADHGTLFLDEIGEIPLPLQAKLLRIIQEKTFERVGGSSEINSDVRIITATNKELKEEVDLGHFREDLYYRINVLNIHVPPLRERMDDIPLLARHFVDKFARQLSKPDLTISEESIAFLSSLPWEGNIRELENTLERASILCNNNRIEPEDVQPDIISSNQPELDAYFNIDEIFRPDIRLPDILNALEKKMIVRAMEQSEYVQTKAAQSLGITKSLLQYKMKKFGIKKKAPAH